MLNVLQAGLIVFAPYVIFLGHPAVLPAHEHEDCETGFPSLEEVAFLPDTENDGYGRPFNGTMVSHVLEPRGYGPFDFPNHCLKCGGEVTIAREAIYLTATCDDCGEIAMATYTDPFDGDSSKCVPSGPLA